MLFNYLVIGTDIVYLADLQPQPVEWLWQHRLAAATLAMLSGEPGSGKTWVALAIAAALTCGRDPFTGETNDLFGNLAKSQNLKQMNVFGMFSSRLPQNRHPESL